MQLLPEQIARALVNESFYSRRAFVALFVIVNAVMLPVGLLWPSLYRSTSILIDERTIIQPLMQGARSRPTPWTAARTPRDHVRPQIMDIVLEYGGC